MVGHDPITNFGVKDPRPDRIDDPGTFVSERKLVVAVRCSFLGALSVLVKITTTDSRCLDSDTYIFRTWLRYWFFVRVRFGLGLGVRVRVSVSVSVRVRCEGSPRRT